MKLLLYVLSTFCFLSIIEIELNIHSHTPTFNTEHTCILETLLSAVVFSSSNERLLSLISLEILKEFSFKLDERTAISSAYNINNNQEEDAESSMWK
jgi:hypothetical protein